MVATRRTAANAGASEHEGDNSMITTRRSALKTRTRLVATCALLGLAAWAAQAQDACGPLGNHYGPFDYRTQRDKLKVVEDYHFNAGVEALVRGQSGTSVAADLSYLMRTSPNHHRGLLAVVRLAEKTKSPHPRDLQYSVECYFDRAIRFQREDNVVRVLYAQYLGKQGRGEQARQQLATATELAKENPLSHYNIGLMYFDLGAYDEALAQAHRARALGMERDELEKMLKSRNKWKEPAS
jgi:tetratricopeptide (TPR) repeat protein